MGTFPLIDVLIRCNFFDENSKTKKMKNFQNFDSHFTW